MNGAYVVDATLLDELSARARASPRLRRHLNFHRAETDPCHRYLNAIEPGSYVQPHRHLEPTKDETLFVVRGRLGVIIFDDHGAVTSSAVLSPGGARVAVHVPHGCYHSVIALEPGTVMLGAKAGPYAPPDSAERAPWAPGEGEAEVADYLESLVLRLA